MSLPINRTAKSTLDINLVNGNTSDAPAVKASNDVVYNTIDELYNYTQGLLSTGSLTQASKTPVANKIAQYDANANLVSSFPVSNGQNPNLLFNPSARLGLNGWTVTSGASTWSALFDGFGGGGWFQSPTINAASGVYQTVEGQRIPIVAGQTLNVSFELDTSHLTAGLGGVEIHAYDSSNVDIGSVGSTVNFGSAFTKSSLSYTMPANTSYVKVRMFTNTTSVGYALFRKIKVELGTYATTFSDDNTFNTVQYGSVLGLAQVLSGGYKTQSGASTATVAVGGTAVNVTLTFPVAFGSTPIAMAVATSTSVNTATYINVAVVSSSATSITFGVNSGTAQAINFTWISIGT